MEVLRPHGSIFACGSLLCSNGGRKVRLVRRRRRIARTQLLVFLASWLWSQLALPGKRYASGRIHPALCQANVSNARFPSSDGTVLRSRLLVTRRFRLPRSRRRQTTPPHSRSSLRLKQETARPSQISSGRPIFPRGIRDFEHLPRLLVESLGIQCVDLPPG